MRQGTLLQARPIYINFLRYLLVILGNFVGSLVLYKVIKAVSKQSIGEKLEILTA
jgi:hypothetical protein